MALTYYKFGASILEDVLFRCGELTASSGVTSDYRTAAKRFIQRRYHDIVIAQPWPWALKSSPGVLNIEAGQSNTLTISQDSASGTLGTSISSSVSGYWIWVDSEQVPYRISLHVADATSVTLDASYKESSASAAICTIWKDEYSLATDCWKIWRAWDRNNPSVRIDIIQPSEMNDVYTNRATSGSDVYKLAVIRGNVVRITPWPDTEDITIEYEYTSKIASDLSFESDSTDIPIIPDVDRSILSDFSTADLMMVKNDQRAETILQMAMVKYQQMINTYILVGRFRKYVREGQSIGGV